MTGLLVIWLVMAAGLYLIFGFVLLTTVFAHMPFLDAPLALLLLWPAVVCSHFNWLAVGVVGGAYAGLVYFAAYLLGLA